MKIKYQESLSRLRSLSYIDRRLTEQVKEQMEHDRKYNSTIMSEQEIKRRATEMVRKAMHNIAEQLILID